MRKIKKEEPQHLGLQPLRQAEAPFGWGELEQVPGLKDAVKDALLAEQGCLCAYTGVEIDASQSHVEHMRPRNPPTGHAGGWWEDGHETDYNNLVACYPMNGGAFGAHSKGSWPGPEEWDLFVTPLEDRCETCFSYTSEGRVVASGGNRAAERTIEELNLDHPELTALRLRRINGVLQAFQQTDPGARTAAIRKEVERLRRRMQQSRPGRLPEFVFVLVDVFEDHL